MNEEKRTDCHANAAALARNDAGGGPMRASTTKEVERTPEMIGAEIRMYVDAGRRITLLCGIEIGRRLVEAKELLSHGEWLPWLERETEFSSSSAQRYMKLFDEYGAAQLGLFGPETNSPTLGNLSISNALRLLALPENEREDFAQEHDVQHLSAREVEELVRQRTAEIEAEKEKIEKAHSVELHDAEEALEESELARRKAEIDREEAEKQLRRIKQELEEIEARPQAVAYERDEEAIAQAVKAERERLEAERADALARAANAAADAERKKHLEAEKKAKERIAALEKEMQNAATERVKIEKALKEAQAKAAEAEKAGADSETLQKQVETLKKQLALAAPEVAEFKAAFDRAQDELGHVTTALHQIQDTEIKEKLRKASLAMLDGVMERVKG